MYIVYELETWQYIHIYNHIICIFTYFKRARWIEIISLLMCHCLRVETTTNDRKQIKEAKKKSNITTERRIHKRFDAYIHTYRLWMIHRNKHWAEWERNRRAFEHRTNIIIEAKGETTVVQYSVCIVDTYAIYVSHNKLKYIFLEGIPTNIVSFGYHTVAVGPRCA